MAKEWPMNDIHEFEANEMNSSEWKFTFPLMQTDDDYSLKK